MRRLKPFPELVLISYGRLPRTRSLQISIPSRSLVAGCHKNVWRSRRISCQFFSDKRATSSESLRWYQLYSGKPMLIMVPSITTQSCILSLSVPKPSRASSKLINSRRNLSATLSKRPTTGGKGNTTRKLYAMHANLQDSYWVSAWPWS